MSTVAQLKKRLSLPPDLPDAVQDLRTNMIQARSVTLIWTVPDPGHTPITLYKIQYSVQGTRDYLNISSKVNTSSLSGLKPNTDYTVNVVAVSVLGEGLWSVKQLHFKTKEAGKKHAGRETSE